MPMTSRERSQAASVLAIGALLFFGAQASAGALPPLTETPSLRNDVEDGRLPPIALRIPKQPLIAAFSGASQPGKPGGTLHTLIAEAGDTRLMVVWGYARLIGYTADLHLQPDLAESIDVKDGRIFTIHLRPGHRWSDGHPFTTEDFRYFWQDIALNRDLSPTGPPAELLVQGHAPRVEVLNPTTIRYSWDLPNPMFLAALAATTPLSIYAPAHYLKQFHARYADPAALEKRVEVAGVRNWAALHNRMNASYRNDNPDLPTLQPWVLRTRPPAQQFVFTRNPYYHRIDPLGHQLPYIDIVVLQLAAAKIIPVATASGESDLQARYLDFHDYTFLKQAAARNDFQVRMWRTARGSAMALYPNLNVVDPVWRKLMRDVRFRRALSLAINRNDINMALYEGLAIEGNNTALEGSPFYDRKNQHAWARYDPAQANRLLDAVGLTRRDGDGFRLLPGGRRLTIIIESSEDDEDQTDALALVRDNWRRVGIELVIRTMQREDFRNRVFSGDCMMAIFFGAENGLPTPTSSPAEWAPTSDQQLQWSQWGNYTETNGKAGEPIDLPAALELLDLYHRWEQSSSDNERTAIWRQMLRINADQVFTIGLVSAVQQPVVVRNTLRNVPTKATYNWDPGALFGIYRPDQFWFDTNTRRPGD